MAWASSTLPGVGIGRCRRVSAVRLRERRRLHEQVGKPGGGRRVNDLRDPEHIILRFELA